VGDRVARGRHVAAHHLVALLAVGRPDRPLDRGERRVELHQLREREKTRLHHGVDAAGHAGRARDRVGVDDEEAQLLLDDRLP
jgi:hypothetical protein